MNLVHRELTPEDHPDTADNRRVVKPFSTLNRALTTDTSDLIALPALIGAHYIAKQVALQPRKGPGHNTIGT
jgi:hypothetical protein